MSESEVVTPEVQAAYDELVAAWQAFGEAQAKASEAGIDVQAVVVGLMRSAVSAEEWDSLPAPVRLMLS